MAAVMYRSSDPGAPVVRFFGLTDPLGDLRKAWIAILIDGYGTRTPVGGWTVAFDDPANNTIAFRQKDGEVFMRLQDNQFAATSELRGFTSMTDVNTGEGAFPTFADSPLNFCRIPKRFNNATSPVNDDWIMIVDSDGQYIYWLPFETNDIDDNSGYFFGKLDRFFAGVDGIPIWLNACNFGDTTSVISTGNYAFSTRSSQNDRMGASNGVSGLGPVRASLTPNWTPVPFTDNQLLDTRKYLTRHYVETESLVSQQEHGLLGAFPGLFKTFQQPINSLIDPADQRTVVTINGVGYLILFYTSGYWFFRVDSQTG